MKLSYGDKVKMYQRWKRREKSPGQLAKEYGVAYSLIEYMLRLMDIHGEEIVRHGFSNFERFRNRIIYTLNKFSSHSFHRN